VNARCLFVYTALLLIATATYGADGAYQRTKDRKTLVWNNDPQPGDAATWSGDRDENGYATGYGTLTWYTAKQVFPAGSNIPSPKLAVFARYSGNMVQGKFDGQVNVNSKGKTAHATFVDGKRASKWSAGPAPAGAVAEQRAETIHNDSQVEPEAPAAGPLSSSAPVSDRQHDEYLRRDAIVETPVEGPSPSPDQKAKHRVAERAVKEPTRPGSDSLRSLTAPPSGLRTNLAADAPPQPSASAAASSPVEASLPAIVSSPPAGPRLTAEEVVGLADAEAIAQGYDLGHYQRPQAHYTARDETWLIVYDQNSVDGSGMGKSGKQFRVNVDDKTKEASVMFQFEMGNF
jgi:hypothetical protein